MNRKTMLMLFLSPAILGLFYLAASILRLFDDSDSAVLETLPFPIFTLILTIVLIAIERKHVLPIKFRGRYAYTLPAFMAPTALFSAWTLAPSHLGGVAWGGIHYFLEAIARYPNFGPVNSSLLMGMLAVLCTAYMPVLIAWGYFSSWSKRTMYVLLLLAVVAYSGVALNIDLNLWIAGIYGTEKGPLVFLAYGPMSRTLSIICGCYIVTKFISDSKTPRSQV